MQLLESLNYKPFTQDWVPGFLIFNMLFYYLFIFTLQIWTAYFNCCLRLILFLFFGRYSLRLPEGRNSMMSLIPFPPEFKKKTKTHQYEAPKGRNYGRVEGTGPGEMGPETTSASHLNDGQVTQSLQPHSLWALSSEQGRPHLCTYPSVVSIHWGHTVIFF